MRCLVAGGAGYIGSHMVKMLLGHGHAVTTLDNFSTGHRDALIGGDLVEGDLADRSLLAAVFARARFDCVMHFAAHIQVGESVRDPGKYYANNVGGTLALLQEMVRARVPALVFSSTAAIFGEPQYVPIDEAHPQAPINPYGTSKWMVERMLDDFDRAHGLRTVCLRYFNAAGADPDGILGERHEPEIHLIPLLLQVASGRRPALSLFGADYDTPDGTCIRDYIHVTDLCDAHMRAMDYLASDGQSQKLNLGNGRGFSTREVIRIAEAVIGRSVTVEEKPRRPGDPARLVADASAARRVLGWAPRRPAMTDIIDDAWRWELRLSGPGSA